MRTLEILEKLVAFPTVSADGNLDLVGFARAHLEACGFTCRTVPNATATKANLFASIGPTNDDGVVLSGHTDVVPVEGQHWASDPFSLTRRHDRVYGRGTTDMKGFLACVLAAAERARRLPLTRPLHIAFSHDEEIGCIGVRGMLDDLKARDFNAALCIVGEPTSMQPVTGHKGKLAARASCRGVPGHSSMAPELLNAIHLACETVGAIRDVQDRLAKTGARDPAYAVPYSTAHAGLIRGGDVLNVVPSSAYVDLEIRHLAEDDVNALLCEIVARAEARIMPSIARFPQAGVEFDIRNAYPGLSIEENSHALCFVQPLLPEPTPAKVSFGTEAGLFVEKLGLPTVIVGPGDMAQGHQPDEFIALDQLHACDRFLDRVIDNLC